MNKTNEELINQLEHFLLTMDRIGVKQSIMQDNDGKSVLKAIEQIVVPALERIGEAWETGKVSLSQVYMSGRICEEMIDTILPPDDPMRIDQPPMAIAVLEDYHMLGKRIVYSALRASGFEIHNYNHMEVETLVSQIKKDDIKILLVSVLMLSSALRVKALRNRLKEENLTVKVLVGGAPFRFDKQLWKEVGADAMGSTASDAVSLVKKFVEEMR